MRRRHLADLIAKPVTTCCRQGAQEPDAGEERRHLGELALPGGRRHGRQEHLHRQPRQVGVAACISHCNQAIDQCMSISESSRWAA